jgi:hypothetical protein
MPDDDLIDLMQTPKSPESGSEESDPTPSQRNGLAFLILLAFFIPIGYFFWKLQDRPGGIQIAIMVAYTAAVPFFASDRFRKPVPWSFFNRFRERFLLGHCLALAIVYGITTGALAVKPRLPAWFTTEGRKGSFFDMCLVLIFIILVICEWSWMSRHERKQASDMEQR